MIHILRTWELYTEFDNRNSTFTTDKGLHGAPFIIIHLRVGFDIVAAPDQLAFYIVFGHSWTQ